MNTIKVIEIGFGPHARRVYAPAMLEWGPKFHAKISLVVDLKQNESEIRTYFDCYKDKPDFLFISPFKKNIPKQVELFLSNYVNSNNIKAVIISTEPLTHYVYAKWALKNDLNILMDKPISTENDVVTDVMSAKKIESKYLDLLKDYNKLQTKKDTIFSINTQRRFHPGFNLVCNLLKEISIKTNCPITSIQSTHCDGQWRLPNEMVTQQYHPYCTGYGKGSHSGYHLFDAVYQFYKSTKVTGKSADSMEIYSSFFQPKGFLCQINQDDYLKYFGRKYLAVRKYTDKELSKIFNVYGEIDISSVIKLKKGNDCVGNIAINLMHNGFGMRTWMKPGIDLYKGNGRVKHEYHNIEQGPFQNIQIHSYQSKDKHGTNTKEDYLLGGNSHFDIYVFRNTKFTGGKETLKIIHMSDLKKYCPEMSDDKLAIERIKHRVIKEFLGFLSGKINKAELTSNIDDHLMPVQIMSGIYRSHNNYIRGQNPLVSYKLEK